MTMRKRINGFSITSKLILRCQDGKCMVLLLEGRSEIGAEKTLLYLICWRHFFPKSTLSMRSRHVLSHQVKQIPHGYMVVLRGAFAFKLSGKNDQSQKTVKQFIVMFNFYFLECFKYQVEQNVYN